LESLKVDHQSRTALYHFVKFFVINNYLSNRQLTPYHELGAANNRIVSRIVELILQTVIVNFNYNKVDPDNRGTGGVGSVKAILSFFAPIGDDPKTPSLYDEENKWLGVRLQASGNYLFIFLHPIPHSCESRHKAPNFYSSLVTEACVN
jgi:hypothetical protein